MARKHLFGNLVTAGLPAGNSAEAADPRPPGAPIPPAAQSLRGAVGAVTRSLEQIKAQGVVELAPALIDASSVADRLRGDEADHAALVASMREHGQQVPILVRPHPGSEGRFQIAYGRRRLRAAAEIGTKVRATVRPLTDEELVVAQGAENTARSDLSFIERALFAADLEANGFKREVIMAALTVDKTGLSRLIAVASRIPKDLIVAIGPAPKAGRDRWLDLAERLESNGALARAQALAAQPDFAAKLTDQRFAAVLEAVSPDRTRATEGEAIRSTDGRRIASARNGPASLQLTIDKRQEARFADFLVDRLPGLYAEFAGSGATPARARRPAPGEPAVDGTRRRSGAAGRRSGVPGPGGGD